MRHAHHATHVPMPMFMPMAMLASTHHHAALDAHQRVLLGLVDGLLVHRVRDRRDQVGDRVDADGLLRRLTLRRGHFDVVAADDEGGVRLGQQQTQHGLQADIHHLRQLHGLIFRLHDARFLERLDVHEDGDAVALAQEPEGFLERRVGLEAVERDRRFHLRLQLFQLLERLRIVVGQAARLVLVLAERGELLPRRRRRELDRRLVGERNVRALDLEHRGQEAFLANALEFLLFLQVIGEEADVIGRGHRRRDRLALVDGVLNHGQALLERVFVAGLVHQVAIATHPLAGALLVLDHLVGRCRKLLLGLGETHQPFFHVLLGPDGVGGDVAERGLQPADQTLAELQDEDRCCRECRPGHA